MRDARVRSPLRSVLRCASLVLLACCRLHEPPSQPHLIEKALPAGTTIPEDWTQGAGQGEVSDDWLRSFGDPGLDAVVAEAIQNNLDLLRAADAVEAARAKVVLVASQLLPQIGARIGGHQTHVSNPPGEPGNGAEWIGNNEEYLGISWELDVWGKLRSLRSAAEAESETTALTYAFARQSLAATTARSWYLAIEARLLLELAETDVGIYRKLLDLVEQRRAAGKVADFDVVQAHGAVGAAESHLQAARGADAEARTALELILGRYPAAEIEVATTFVPVPPPVAAGMPSTLLARRPDLVAAEREVIAAFRIEEATKLALLPSFSITLEGGRFSDNVLSVLKLNPWLFHGVVGIDVPIYTGGALRARIRIASAEQAQAVAAYGSAALRAFGEVETTLRNEDLYAKRLALNEQVLADRTEASRIAVERYKAGASDLLTVLELQLGQIHAQSEVIELRNAGLANRIDLHLALGGGFDATPAVTVDLPPP